MKRRVWRAERSSIEPMIQWIGFVAVIVALGLLYVWQQIETRDLNREILLLEARKTDLIQENSRLHVGVARKATLARIEDVASNMLGLEYPMIGQVVSITESTPVRVLLASSPNIDKLEPVIVEAESTTGIIASNSNSVTETDR